MGKLDNDEGIKQITDFMRFYQCSSTPRERITEAIIMKILNLHGDLNLLLFLMLGILMFSGCDSGQKVIDKATGNQDVKQFQKMKKDIGKIADQQTKKYNEVSDEK